MADKPQAGTRQQRRQQQRRLEQAKRRQRMSGSAEPPVAEGEREAATADPPDVGQPGRKKRPGVTAADIQGMKYFDKLAPLLERLHDDGCERDRAGNRNLHFDQYCMLVLLYMFCPVVTSLRGIAQTSGLDKVQRMVRCCRRCRRSCRRRGSKSTPGRDW